MKRGDPIESRVNAAAIGPRSACGEDCGIDHPRYQRERDRERRDVEWTLAIYEADQAASECHDAIYAEPFDKQAASDAIWRVHNALRPFIQRDVDGINESAPEEPKS